MIASFYFQGKEKAASSVLFATRITSPWEGFYPKLKYFGTLFFVFFSFLNYVVGYGKQHLPLENIFFEARTVLSETGDLEGALKRPLSTCTGH